MNAVFPTFPSSSGYRANPPRPHPLAYLPKPCPASPQPSHLYFRFPSSSTIHNSSNCSSFKLLKSCINYATSIITRTTTILHQLQTIGHDKELRNRQNDITPHSHPAFPRARSSSHKSARTTHIPPPRGPLPHNSPPYLQHRFGTSCTHSAHYHRFNSTYLCFKIRIGSAAEADDRDRKSTRLNSSHWE